MDTNQGDVTRLLQNWPRENAANQNQLMELVYRELYLISKNYMRKERANHTLDTTALVNEAYLKLIDQTRVNWRNRAHFFGVAAQAMRRILVDYANSRKAAKRGGGESPITFERLKEVIAAEQLDLSALDEALNALAAFDERKVRVVEMKFFAGMTEQEIAEALELSPATVRRDWQSARVWLFRFLEGS